MNTTRSKAASMIFWGAIWGLAEASLGYLLHLMPGLISGTVMFPIGLYCMTRAAGQGKISDIFGVAMIAAAIKSVNLLFPQLTPVSTIHPMIAILLQAGFAYGFISARKRAVSVIMLVPAVMIGWRIAFIGVQVLSASMRGADASSFVMAALPKLALGSLIDIALVSLWLRLSGKQDIRPLAIRLNLASLMLCLAVISQTTISLLA